jgi:hypothetical protein
MSVADVTDVSPESARPCRFCVAAWTVPTAKGTTRPPILPTAQECEWEHRDDPRVYDLALAMAKMFQHRKPSDAQIGYFLADADAVIDDFDPPPDEWTVAKRRTGGQPGEFDARMSINGVVYVLQQGDKESAHPVSLKTYRSWSAS